ncbi:GGDEF domain-containing protein [Alteromonas stellipolaris]|uniref:GGDEF domain-containing protein n=1 Tax=Alteromonas stellipolaris TaxID=233316 RepID=UPI0026E22CA2|nr:GGDEF domain-containing protein [Alteromonas stellipolaris]MDO6534798.1 diguanylate cyclase [Alteromonas stellipolaris]MDO6626675.1 diguanylate cyclase [Alteromonas stellipolaris]
MYILRFLLCLLLITSLHVDAQRVDTGKISDIDALKVSIRTERELGNIQKAELLTQNLQGIVAKSQNPELQADLATITAENEISRTRYPHAIELLKSAELAYSRSSNDLALAYVYTILGYAYYSMSDYPLALDYYHRGERIYNALDDKKSLSMVGSYMGLALGAIGDYDGAILAYQTALDHAIEQGSDAEKSQVFYSLGGLNAKMGDHRSALAYFYSSLEIDTKRGMVQNIAFNNALIAESLLALSDFEAAESHANEAIRLFNEVKSTEYADMYKLTLAKIHIARGSYDQANDVIQNVLHTANGRFPALTLNALVVAAQHAFLTSEHEISIDYADQGIKKAKQAERLPIEVQFHEAKVNSLEAMNRFDAAFIALKELMRVKEKLNNENKVEAIARAQAQTETVRKELELDLKLKEQALEQAGLSEKLLLKNFFIGLILILFSLLFVLYRRYTLRKANERLEWKVRIQTRELSEKNEQLIQSLKLIESESITDTLTGLKNRRYLQKFIKTDIALCDREFSDWHQGKSRKPIGSDLLVFIVDIDDFKQVNDRFGHQIGDEVLIEFSKRLEHVFRQSDYIVRWGGEEFVTVARFVDRKSAMVLAQRLVKAINDTKFEMHDNMALPITCSVGYVCYPLIPTNVVSCHLEKLLEMSDACLYLAKASGKNTWVGLESVNDEEAFAEDFNKSWLETLIRQKRVTIRREPGK